MTWWGENRSGRDTRWNIGDLVRYDDGPTALMRINHIREMGPDQRGIACEVRYYGRAFHDQRSRYDTGEERSSVGRYHGQCLEPTDEDRERWASCHDSGDDWIRGAWG